MVQHPIIYLARHAETVYNAAQRAQGALVSSPLTRRGIEQSVMIGEAMRRELGSSPCVDVWSSPTSRTQQTVAIIAELLAHSFFDVKMDPRLIEIGLGEWEGQYYADVVASHGSIFDASGGFFIQQAPGGEWYPQIAARLREWLRDIDPSKPAIVISHGITTRVLRGLIVAGTFPCVEGVAVAHDAPQGTVFRIERGIEAPINLVG